MRDLLHIGIGFNRDAFAPIKQKKYGRASEPFQEREKSSDAGHLAIGKAKSRLGGSLHFYSQRILLDLNLSHQYA